MASLATVSDPVHNAGVSSSSGEVRPRSSTWAVTAIAFIKALGLKQV